MRRLRQFFTIIIIGCVVWMGVALGNGSQLQARAANYTAGSGSYNDNSKYSSESHTASPKELQERTAELSDRATRNSERQIDNSQSKLKDAADTVREKLNLDQPIYPGTKEFLNDVQEKVESAIPGS